MCVRTKHYFYYKLSRKDYDSYVKESKIIKIFNEYGLKGLNKLIPNNKLLILINEEAEMVHGLWINAATFICIYNKNLDLVRYLLQFIANNEQLTYEDWEHDRCLLLHLLCNTDIMDDRVDIYLGKFNVDINILDTFGRNCLFYIHLPEMYNYLISRGANKQIRDRFGYSPIFYYFVCGYENLAMQLLNNDDRKQIAKFIIEEAETDRQVWMSILENIVLPTPEFADAFLFMAIKTRHQGCSKVYLKLAGIYETDDLVLLDIYDCFLIRTRGYTSKHRLEFLMDVLKNKNYLVDQGPKFISYKKLLEILFQYPDVLRLTDIIDFIGEFCDYMNNYMDYMHEVMKALDRWTFHNKYLFAMCWVYNCWLRNQKVIPYLQRLLAESKDVVFDFVRYQAHNHLQIVNVNFIRLCLDNGLSANARQSLLDFCQHHLHIAENKRQLCKLLLEYGGCNYTNLLGVKSN